MRSAIQLEQLWQAIAYLLGEVGEFPEGVDRTLLESLVRTHRLDAPLAEPMLTGARARQRVPESVWRHWQATHTATLIQAVHRHAELKKVLAALAPIPVILTKGFALAELIYPTPAARSMSDADLLVPAADLERSLELLVPLGYRKEFPGHRVWDHPDFHERQLLGPIDLDLHQAFVQRSRLDIDYAAIFDRAIQWPTFAPNARVLAPEDAVVYAALHLALGELTPVWAPAIGLLDLREMLRRKGPFWGFGSAVELKQVAVRAREWRAERMVFVALEAMQRVFPSATETISAIELGLPRTTTELLTRAFVNRALPLGIEAPFRAEVLLRKALVLRPTDRLRFVKAEIARRR